MRTKLRKQITEALAENMSIYAAAGDADDYLPQAQELMRRFKATEGRWPSAYLEIEEWSRGKLDKSGRLLVVK
jgi:hypothetical protein